MTRTQTMVQLNEQLIALLDEEASRRGMSRSALIRTALESYLEQAGEAALTRAIVDGYRRLPPATPDAWGDLGALGDRSTSELLQRLDVEDAAAGHDPW